MVLAQRFGGALNLNLHFHALVLDGVYTSERPFAPPRFQPARELTDQDVVHVTGLLVRRIVRYLQRRGRLPREEHVELDEPAPDEPLLALISAASVEGRIALGPESGQPLTRRVRQRDRRPLFLAGKLCCDLGGFSLHAKVAIEGHDRALTCSPTTACWRQRRIGGTRSCRDRVHGPSRPTRAAGPRAPTPLPRKAQRREPADRPGPSCCAARSPSTC